MSAELNELCTMPYDEVEGVINRRADLTINAALAQPDRQYDSLEDLHARVDSVKQMIQDLEVQRLQPHTWELIHDLATARAARSFLLWRLFPINSLPVEILEHILSLAILSTSASEVTRTRMVLVTVCSYWRSIAINTPRLWSIIPITCRPPFHFPLLCIKRAKAHPLVLLIDQRDSNWSRLESDHKLGPEDMKSLMNFVSSRIDDIRQLYILADTWALILAALNVLQTTPTPRLLDRLEIHRSGRASAGETPESFSTAFRLFGGAQAPMLEHVCFNGVHIDFAPASFRNLRVFDLRKMTIDQMPTLDNFISVLQESPQLEKLALEGACPKLSNACDDSNWQPIQLMSLRELVIASLVPNYAIYILKLIAAPDLRRLTLEKLIGEDFTGFVKELPNRFPKVTVLTANGLGVNDTGALVAWLRTLPRLRYLRVSRVADEFFTALLIKSPKFPISGNQSEPQWIPVGAQLEAIEIMKCSSINMQALQTFHRERLIMQVPLKRIYVPEGELKGAPAEEWLRSTGILSKVPPDSLPYLSSRYDSD